MDRLNDEERVLAWKAIWHPSFVGTAIVSKDFTFLSANPTFCKLLGVTLADLLGKRFQDITHPSIRAKDEQNAKFLIDGLQDYYILEKKYLFEDGREVDVVLLVTRAPLSSEGPFRFFVSRIMLDDKKDRSTLIQESGSGSEQSFQKQMETVAAFLMRNIKFFTAIGTVIAAIYLGFIEFFKGGQ